MMKTTKSFERDTMLEIHEGNRYEIFSTQSERPIIFPEGILGFEDVHQYVLQLNEEIKPFLILQSIDHPELSFICIESFGICKGFSINLPQPCAEFLGLTREIDSLVLSLVTVRRDIEEMTANLMSPIVVNLDKMLAKQVIISNSQYPVRYNILKGCSVLRSADLLESKAG